jgi:uncharacterized protein
MKIAILSDSHDHWTHLKKAVQIANDCGCEALLFIGDLISPGIAYLEAFQGQVHFVFGNNEGAIANIVTMILQSKNITLHGSGNKSKDGNYADIELGGKRIFFNHYPIMAELAAKTQNYDIVIHGHTHEYYVKQVGKTLLMNPGEIHGFRTGTAGFVVLDLTTLQTERVILAENVAA